jgi:hypothetical protein
MEKELLEKVIEYIREKEETIDGEWGSGRSWEALEKEGEMPELYFEIRKLLEPQSP